MAEQSPRTRKRPLTKSQANLLRRHLRDRDAPCPFCDFNLRNFEEQHCPECHEPLSYTKLKRGLPKSKDEALDLFCEGLELWWIVGKGMILPLALIFLLAVVGEFDVGDNAGALFVWFSIAVVFDIVLIVFCPRLVRLLHREPRRFTDLPRGLKWFIAITIGVSSLGGLILLLVM